MSKKTTHIPKLASSLEKTEKESDARTVRPVRYDRQTDGNFRVPQPNTPLEFTGERMTTTVQGQTEFEHFHRYCITRDLCAGLDVLDVASGEGYGSALLAAVAKSVTGVEIDSKAVAHAAQNYRATNLRFLQGDALALPLQDASVDFVVSFETIEHVSDPNKLVSEARRVLRPGGCLLISTPDRAVYSAQGSDPNPYHVVEMTEPEFHQLLQAHFAHLRIFAQRPVLGSVLAGQQSTRWRSYERRSPELIEATNGLARAHYLIAVASDGELPKLASSIYLDRRPVHAVIDASIRLPAEVAHAAQMSRERDAALLETSRANSRIAELQSNCAVAESALKNQEEALVQLRIDAEVRTISLQAANGKLAERNEALAQLRADVEARTIALQAAERGLADKDEALAQLRADVEVRNTSLHAAQQEIAERGQQYIVVKSERDIAHQELVRVGNHLRQIEASIAWRITKPIRRMSSRYPRLALWTRKFLKLVWLTVSGGLASHLAARRRDRSLARQSGMAASQINSQLFNAAVGADEGRDPHPLFNATWYLEQNPDVRDAGVNPLAHYLEWGAQEGRNPHPLFSTAWYLEQNPDVRDAGVNPLAHYLERGAQEGRDPHPLFDGAYYRDTYLRAAKQFVNPLLDYVTSGAAMGRNPNAAFYAAGYAYEHEEVSRFGGNALIHYVTLGRAAGFHAHPLFERDWYLANNPDVVQSGQDPYEHYVRYGLSEGRLGSRALGGDPKIAGPFPLAKPDDKPEVVIIIPVYKRYFETYRCLVSISRMTGDRVSYTVALADDCPEKPVAELLADFFDIEVIANEKNLGFLKNCNHAAEVTSSNFIVFLNNDTAVCKDWLAPMVDLAARDPLVGMVGCKLLNPDETIQEAGGIISRDGWGHSYGRGDDPRLPQYNFVREVDCVIGACMLVRRSIFAALGGFDVRYAPAYYEEFDLAFALQQMNYRVMYQPASEVYHFDCGSYGIETRNRQSLINHAKFCQKWASSLKNKYEGKEDSFRARERLKCSGTILFIDDAVPEPDKHAGAQVTFLYLQLLAEHNFKVIYVPHDRRARQPYTRNLQQMGIEVLFGDFDFAEWLDKFGEFIDHIWLARPDVAMAYLKLLRSKTQARICYYTHDLHFLREMRRYEIDGDQRALSEYRRLKPIETQIFNSVDCVITPSSDEVPIIKQLAPQQMVRSLILYFFKQSTMRPSATAKKLEQRHEIIFVGGYAHIPNVDAADFLVRSIMPYVWPKVPDAQVLIVGSNPPAQILALNNDRVKVIGYVPELAPYYERARMSVSALRYGAGVKGKIISSLEAGVPVVTTTIGNEGIGLRSGVEALIADKPEELAAHIVTLFQDNDLLNSMAAAGKRVISERFSEEKARDGLFDVLQLHFCNICGDRSPLGHSAKVKSTTKRKGEFACERCLASNRTRALADVLIKPYRQFNCPSVYEALPYLADLHIHEFGFGGPIHDILQGSKNFSYSEYFEKVRPGERVANGTLRQDVQQLTFADDVFDVCIAEDVFAHNPDTERGFAEIFRTLAPGGRLLFTAQSSRQSATLNVSAGDKKGPAEHFLPAAADPIYAGRASVSAACDDHLIQMLESIGFIVSLHEFQQGDVSGGYFSVFDARKP